MARLLAEAVRFVWGGEPKNYTGAALTAKYVSLKNYRRMAIIINTGAWAGGTAAVTLSQAQKVDGTGAKALSFASYYDDKTTSGVLVKKAATSNTFNLDTANKQFVIELKATDLDLANGFNAVSVAVASPGTNADLYSVVYALYDGRFEGANQPSVVVD